MRAQRAASAVPSTSPASAPGASPILLKINRGPYDGPPDPNVYRTEIVSDWTDETVGVAVARVWGRAEYERLPEPRPKAQLTDLGVYLGLAIMPPC